MGLRVVGALVALLLVAFAAARYRRGELRRGELLVVALVAGGLLLAALTPDVFDPLLGALGFEPGKERRIVGLLVILNLFTLALVVRGFSRDDRLSNELAELVDRIALRRFEQEGGTGAKGRCVVVIPAHDEAGCLPAVLAALPKVAHGVPVVSLVVADGCNDETASAARALGAAVLEREVRRGSGAAVRLGYRAAVRAGAAIVVTLDADGQHDPADVPRLVEPLLAGEADVVQGSRVLGSSEVGSRVRALGVTVFARVLTALAGTRITDPSTGYRALTADALERLELRQEQFYVSELILDAARKRLRITEVPITMRARAVGLTKKPPPLRYAWGFGKAVVRTWLR